MKPLGMRYIKKKQRSGNTRIRNMIVEMKILTRDCRYSHDIKKANKAKYKNAFDCNQSQMRFFNVIIGSMSINL
ncbi:MAG: hypothetical protein DWP97_14010 [Calditrichaeota bacterium]|nr:MAG: hypothetical protein DWP97_14010 [Calditrichota bacterium]